MAEAAPRKAKNSRLIITAVHLGLPAFIIRRINRTVNKWLEKTIYLKGGAKYKELRTNANLGLYNYEDDRTFYSKKAATLKTYSKSNKATEKEV